MIYEFTIKESSKTVIPVRANNPDKAQKIFSEWYDEHDGDPMDTTIPELLGNGYDGRVITRSAGIPEELWNARITEYSVILPEERPKPQEPKYSMHIRFADGRESEDICGKTLREIGMELASLGDKYHLFPDAGDEYGLVTNLVRKHDGDSVQTFWIYAVLKDQEETWCEIT